LNVGQQAAPEVRALHARLETKRVSFLSHMQEWAGPEHWRMPRAISDTDYGDVQNAIEDGITEGIGG